MAITPIISSARFRDDADVDAGGPGTRAIVDYLHNNVGDDYTIVEVERPEGRFSLIIDADWVRLAQSAFAEVGDVLDDLQLPRRSLLAVAVGWSCDWRDASGDLSVSFSPDLIPHLRLTSLRPSPSGADRNAWRS